jgi:hypothetical protein
VKSDYPCSMRISHRSFKQLLALAPVLALCLSLSAQAKVLTAKVAVVKTGAVSLTGVRMSLDWPEGAASGTLRIRAELFDLPTISYQAKDVDWQCPLLRAGEAGWRCAGSVRSAGSSPQKLSLLFSPEETELALGIGDSKLGYQNLASAPDRSRLTLEKIPVAWLKAFLNGIWSEGSWTAGKLGGTIDVLTPEKAPFQVQTDLQLAGIGLETPDGLLAAAALDGRLQLNYREQGKTQSVDTRFDVRGGELLFDSFYAVFPASPVNVRVLAERNQGEAWRLPNIEWKDAGVMAAKGSATLDLQSSPQDLDLTLEFADLGVARDRYLSGYLAPAGFAGLLLKGKLDANLKMSGGEMSAMSAQFNQVNAVDSKARFTFAGIDGSLRWTMSDSSVSSDLNWESGAIYGIGLGPAQYPFSSGKGELKLRSPVVIDALEGTLVLDHLRWQAPEKELGAKFQFGLTMDALDLGSLSQRLGWPPFTGSVGGKIPSARFEDDILVLDGGVHMNLFGGRIDLDELSMERPFGVAPTLSVGIQDIDLEPMTGVFGFGAITGRLDGRIDNLRLVNWSPVAFDARLETDKAWKGKRRISQRAVNDISSIGGSGLVGGLQTQVLKFFNDFGYEQIGIGCKLKDNVCLMDGLGSAGNGYIIVKGSGLPRIQVVGFRPRVHWPTLVSRLKAATEGQAPIIQ